MDVVARHCLRTFYSTKCWTKVYLQSATFKTYFQNTLPTVTGQTQHCFASKAFQTQLHAKSRVTARIVWLAQHVVACFPARNFGSQPPGQPDKWENLLGNRDKQEKISEIPVKRENIYTVPNLLSLGRLCLTPYLAHLVITSQHKLALGLFIFASITDVVDGQIARKWPSQQSALGSALDPLADKILVAVLCGALTYVNIIPLPLTLLFVSRDLLLIGAVFYLRWRTCPPPRTVKRFFDPTLVNAKLSPTFISKINTALQMTLIWCSVAAPAFDVTDHIALKCLWGITALTTVASGLSYVTRKDTVRILKENKE